MPLNYGYILMHEMRDKMSLHLKNLHHQGVSIKVVHGKCKYVQVQICAGINTMSTSNNALKYSFNFMALVIRQNQFCSIMSRNPFKKWSEQRHRKRLRERGEYICIHYLETQKDGICRRQHAGRTAALGVNYSKYIDYYVGLEPGQAGGGPVI